MLAASVSAFIVHILSDLMLHCATTLGGASWNFSVANFCIWRRALRAPGYVADRKGTGIRAPRIRNDMRAIVRQLANSVRKRGLLGTLMVIRRHKTFRSFDGIYGTDTAGYIAVENLQIESANKKHGYPYEPTPMKLFEKLLREVKVRHEDYVFLDFGSGKGRTLLLASNYPFKKVIGVEYSLDLHTVALKNIAQYRSRHRRCFNVESVCIDATEYVIPVEPAICFFFNPFDEKIMSTVLTNITKSLARYPRDVKFIYCIPWHVHLFDEFGFSRDQLLLHEADKPAVISQCRSQPIPQSRPPSAEI